VEFRIEWFTQKASVVDASVSKLSVSFAILVRYY